MYFMTIDSRVLAAMILPWHDKPVHGKWDHATYLLGPFTYYVLTEGEGLCD